MSAGILGLLMVGQALTFTDAVARAAEAPSVVAALETEDARAEHAQNVSRLTANPSVLLQPGARQMKSGGSGGEFYLTVSQRLNLGGLGKKRKETLERELQHDAARSALALREARRMAAEAWLARWTADQELGIAREEARLADDLALRLSPLVDAGEATRGDVAGAKAWGAEARLAALSAEGGAFSAGIALALAIGVKADAPQAAAAELPLLDLPEGDLAPRIASASATPAVAFSAREVAMEEARLAEVKASRAPALGVGAQAWREGTGDVAAVLNLEVEIPAFERGERERASQAAQVAQAQGRAREATSRAEGARALALHELEHTYQVMETTERELVSAAESFAEAQRLRLEAREGTVQDWLLARRAVLKARIEAVRARANHVLARFLARELLSHEAPRNAP